jgi:acyl-coenzyme A synthetase/AMP-(fatty) acid ligase/acyl carrier protein
MGSIHPDLSSLRWLLVTGEALRPELCDRWMSLYPGLPLMNAYGPTECSDDVTHYTVRERPSAGVIHMPVGRPVCNMRMYVLDRISMVVPSGVHGELLVGGVGVGRGYLKDPVRTAEVFTPDPFSTEMGGRLYKTGDLVRYLPDGNIEFRGRIDHQVKIRGHRIELAEIEVVLSLHPAIQQAILLARDDWPRDKRLVAYVIPARQPAPMPIELHDFLKDRLPDYMVPSAFVMLDSLPLTANGKIDRAALPEAEKAQTTEATQFVAPETDLEKRLAEIWSELLEINEVGIFNNFFALGGHSLLAIRVVNRMNQAFKVNLSVRNIFEEPTIADLALTIEEMLIEALEAESDQ